MRTWFCSKYLTSAYSTRLNYLAGKNQINIATSYRMSYPFCHCLLLRPGPSLKIGSVVVVVVFFLVGVASWHFWGTDWFAGCVPITCIWRAGKTQYFYSARSSKYEVPRSEMCVSGLYHLFSVPLILLTNVYNGFGRPTLNFVERFWLWLGSVRSVWVPWI